MQGDEKVLGEVLALHQEYYHVWDRLPKLGGRQFSTKEVNFDKLEEGPVDKALKNCNKEPPGLRWDKGPFTAGSLPIQTGR
ncbi:hypothetical protein hamaS1_07720 [Moorella sp. Hama-1]|nr:hypothetical protein hamaS1_07720 [Moorella sp. Hama-1]